MSHSHSKEPKGLDVLVVDDEAASRTALCAAVEVLGHHCRQASNGVDALEMHRRHRADVIVSDWRMAGMDGVELCRRVRAMDGGTYTYILFTTGSASRREVVDAVRAGADDYIPKPIDVDELEARLIAAERVVHAYRALSRHNVVLRHDSQAFFRASRTDPLTRVANRLSLEEDIDRLQGEVNRYSKRVSVAMCDLDQFKRYNDHFGHVAGDHALTRIAGTMRASLRSADRVYRYGGEEFLVLLPEQGIDAAGAAMNRVREAVQGLGIEHAPGALHRAMTVSVGLASVSAVGHRSLRAAIEEADHALYRAKARGGNRVVGELAVEATA